MLVDVTEKENLKGVYFEDNDISVMVPYRTGTVMHGNVPLPLSYSVGRNCIERDVTIVRYWVRYGIWYRYSTSYLSPFDFIIIY